MSAVRQILGRLLTQSIAYGHLLVNGTAIMPKCTNATITVGDETTNVRPITIQLLDALGNDLDESAVVEAFVFADAGGLALAGTGGSTGIAAGTDGAILQTVIAKKRFTLSSEADGDIDLTWTDTGTEEVFLGLRLPNGRMIISESIANAA